MPLDPEERDTSRFGSTLSDMTYEESVNLLFTQLPMYQRQGAPAYKANLEATKRLCKAIGHPEKGLRFVHVAGTNGKGTVSHMMTAALQLSGHRVGLFTSPHLMDFRERIRVDGACIDESSVVEFVERWQRSEDWGTPSFFELTFAMGLWHFQATQCDIVVLETGMGGRLDSTNVIPSAEVCVVTNVGLDHQAFLGCDIRSIAREKAGIFKHGVPVVLGAMRPEAQSEMLAAALRTSSEVHFANDLVVDWDEASISDGSPFAVENARTARCALDVLSAGGWALDAGAIQEAFISYASLSGQRGRWQWIRMKGQAEVVLDGAHNHDGVSGIVGALEKIVAQRGCRLHVVWGAVADKSLDAIMSLLPSHASYHWCAADIPRALPARDVATVRPSLKGELHVSPLAALQAALKEAANSDVVWVGGSLFVIGDVLRDAPQSIDGWTNEENEGEESGR